MLSQKSLVFVFIALFCVYFIGFGIDIMDIDASQYAEMSREMGITNSYLQVFELGKDYLDKPPFLFWVTSLSTKIFGANNFAYRLPSFLFSLLALYSTYRFALLFYKREIAIISMVVLASCQAFFLINHDIKTDTILMSTVILSIWQLAAWFKKNKWKHLVIASVAIGAGMLTKGPIALIVPILSFIAHFIFTRTFKSFLKWEYLVALLIVSIILLPMSIGLYQQFDTQPLKIVNGKTGVSGLRFFYWTQSFGRITGESIWNNNATIYFLLQNLLWAFLPWIMVFLIALFFEIKTLLKQKFKIETTAEFLCVGGFILTYLALGSSKYQLPHYIFVVLPYASIITAKFLYKLIFEKQYPKLLGILEKSHYAIFGLLWVAIFILIGYCFPAPWWLVAIAAVLFIFQMIYFAGKGMSLYFIKLSLFTFISINLFLNAWVYPNLLKYQAGNTIGRFIKTNNINPKQTFIYQDHVWHSLHFYANNLIVHKDSTGNVLPGDVLIIRTEKLTEFTQAGKSFDVLKQMESYGISRLKIKFLMPSTRLQNTTSISIIKIR